MYDVLVIKKGFDSLTSLKRGSSSGPHDNKPVTAPDILHLFVFIESLAYDRNIV